MGVHKMTRGIGRIDSQSLFTEWESQILGLKVRRGKFNGGLRGKFNTGSGRGQEHGVRGGTTSSFKSSIAIF